MGKKRGYAPDELQRAIDMVAESRKEKEAKGESQRATREERKAADSLLQRRLFAGVLSGIALCSVGYATLQMGWVRFGHPGALQDALASPETAQVLHLEAQKLRSVPADVGALINLKALYLDGNSLDTLPPEIARLTHLETLTLSYNKLSSLPADLKVLSLLRKLSLKANSLSSLPHFLTELTALEELDISENRVTSLPDDLGRLSKLRVLRVSGNAISQLPNSVSKLRSLQELDLSSNPITALPAPESFPKLKRLNLKGTQVDDQTVAAYQKMHPKVRLLR